QPTHCCEGFSCSENATNIALCPQGYFCIAGTVNPIPCDFFAISSFNRLNPVSKTFDIEFENIGLVLYNDIEILKGIKGKFQHGRTCAIMGPSGAGKTTLISILTGKVKKTSGTVKVNCIEEPLEKYRKLIGFVPQEDVMLRELTVIEILMHSALMRLPANMNKAVKRNKVIEVIKFLKLNHVMHSKIGNEEKRGISGGQRKRVNIGIELVAEPSILFLVNILDHRVRSMYDAKRRAKNQHLTVVAIIHSPSPQVFKTFDDLLLLDNKGGLVYFGKTNEAKHYFESSGYYFPDEREESHADFMMRIASGTVHPHYWSRRNYQQELKSNQFLTFIIRLLLFWKRDPTRDTPNMFRAFLLLLKRAYLQVYRSPVQFLSDQFVHLLCGILISVAISDSEYKGKPPSEVCAMAPYVLKGLCAVPFDFIKNVGTFMSIGMTFIAASAGTSTFGFEKAVYWRDVSSGMHTIPYFLAKIINDIPRIIISALMFALSIIVLYPFEVKFLDIYFIVLSNYFASWSMGAGKTTLISILTGKVKKTSGTVKVNCIEEPLEKYRKLIGFVPQEDVMLRELTVIEILMHSALMRLPANMNKAVKRNKVIEVIKFLKLNHVMHSKIGNEEKRGISGGQRKRVNIGIELVAEPSILFLVNILDHRVRSMYDAKRRAKNQHLTVVAIIHSPSPQVFKTFDDLLLLDNKGGLVYFGKTNEAKHYFESSGYYFPDEREESHADFMMRIASGTVHPHYWSRRNYQQELKSNQFLTFIIRLLLFWKRDPTRDTPNMFRAFLLLLKRAYLQVYRSPVQFLSDQFVHLLCGILISVAISDSEYKGKPPSEVCAMAPYVLKGLCAVPFDFIKNVGTFMSIGMTFIAASAGTSTFGFEKAVYWRDVSSGMHTIPYFLAKIINDIPRIIISALMFALSIIVLYPFEVKFLDIYFIVLSNYFASWSMGYVISILVRKERFGLVCSGFSIAWGLVFSGGSVTLEDVKNKSAYQPFKWLWEISAQRWVIEAVYLKELEPRP
ncbi:36519_t:CDS:10, partial [Racocetra persica]